MKPRRLRHVATLHKSDRHDPGLQRNSSPPRKHNPPRNQTRSSQGRNQSQQLSPPISHLLRPCQRHRVDTPRKHCHSRRKQACGEWIVGGDEERNGVYELRVLAGGIER
jgi:hypothetical protein